MGFILPKFMREKIVILALILLTILSSLSLTSCTSSYSGDVYFPEGIWDEFE